ncbi:MAG: phospholipase, partial [Deltaproteobacteria bacterium]
MNIQSACCPCFSREKNFVGYITIILILLGMASTEAFSDTSRDLAACAKIEDDAKRLNCYDGLSGRKPRDLASAEELGEPPSPKKGREVSYFSQLWELDRESRRGKYAIVPHRSNYVLPFTYNDSPNIAAVREADPGKNLKRPEVKFQLSIKTKIWQDILGQEMDLWFGYTQQSFWQFYNFDDSSPFRETNYEPELLLNFRTDYSLLGWKGRFLNVGFNHQSNGQSEPLSRSWNRIVASAGFERGNFSLLLKGWYRIPESAEDDDNPKMGKYLGYGEIWGYYFW